MKSDTEVVGVPDFQKVVCLAWVHLLIIVE